MRTFDVLDSTGNKDYSETLIFKGGKFVKGDGADAVFDAGELLAYLPNGAQAGLLIDKDGKRVEVAGAEVANDSADKLPNPGVRNVGSCITCHAGAGGFILPRNSEEEDRKIGIKRKFKDPEQELRYKEFFEDWEEKVGGYTRPYEKLITRTTRHPALLPGLNQDARPWSGSDIARLTGKLRDDYDAPVSAERAARELGVPVEAFKFLASRSPKHRPLQLLQGKGIPSRTWEVDVMKQMGILLDAFRKNPDYERIVGGR